VLSPAGHRFLAGLLAHARGASAFAAPTINGYKRFQSYSLAPDRAVWGRDNRGAMVRVVGSRHDGSTRLENRVGEPAANPYLYLASQLVAGLDGIERDLDPGPSADEPYESSAEPLPRSLREALDALDQDKQLRAGLGETFVDYYLAIKRAEVARFEQSVTDWEHREYFRMF
jgi:glutamine synthetase